MSDDVTFQWQNAKKILLKKRPHATSRESSIFLQLSIVMSYKRQINIINILFLNREIQMIFRSFFWVLGQFVYRTIRLRWTIRLNRQFVYQTIRLRWTIRLFRQFVYRTIRLHGQFVCNGQFVYTESIASSPAVASLI